jgi:hypothetical protein
VSLVEQTEVAVKAATHLTPMDDGAVEAMRALARKIDAWDVIVGWALDDAAASESRPTVPQNDNVSISAYLKFCESLGLTPAGRKGLEAKKESQGGKLAQLRSVNTAGRSSAR